MTTKRLCILCHQRPREVPDRNVMGKPINKVCRLCHGQRLAGDMRQVLNERFRGRPPHPDHQHLYDAPSEDWCPPAS